jgi:hypothetical protein
MWRILFITITVITLYFAYAIAQGGGIAGFFAGVFVGAVITYLFMRFRTEAASTANVNTQNVQVNLNQQRNKVPTTAFDQESLAVINSLLDQKLQLLLNDRGSLSRLNQQFDDPRLAVLARRLHELDSGNTPNSNNGE